MNRLNMSLDDLIAAKATDSRNNNRVERKQNNGGAIRGTGKKQSVRAVPYEEKSRKTQVFQPSASVQVIQPTVSKPHMSVFARLGKPPVSGTRVTFSNLKSSVEESDMRELCNAIGEIKDVEISFGRGGQMSAVVLFSRRSDAITCVSKFNGTNIRMIKTYNVLA